MDQESIRVAHSSAEIDGCYPVMSQLRPSYSPESFRARVREQQARGYVLAFLEHGTRVVAVAGYQIRETLIDGRFLHVDDLVTDEDHRSRGYGAKLLMWLRKEAQAHGCRSLQLDSGVQRSDAHRFYEQQGCRRIAIHFAIDPAD